MLVFKYFFVLWEILTTGNLVMNGNTNEWSLVRRHPSEKLFGIQVCGSRPQTLVPTAEIIAKSCDIDFLGMCFSSYFIILLPNVSFLQMSTVRLFIIIF